MKVVRTDWLLIGMLLVLGAIPSLVQSNIAFLGTNQTTGEPIPIEEFSQENVQTIMIAADRPAESNIITAPKPFNAYVVEWSPPDDPFFFVEVRTGDEAGNWSDWTLLEASADHTHGEHSPEEDDQAAGGVEQAISDMLFVGGGAETHTQVQLRSSLPAVIPNVRIAFINSVEGPTTDELLLAQANLTASQIANGLVAEQVLANPKPNIISRAVWCTSDLCRPNEGNSGNGCVDSDRLRYTDVSHLVVHHTVTKNTATDWAPIVRAIWQYHGFSRCWGDIGYNYLIDPNGVIYEGHRGGDNVIGTHAGNINSDSMGVALMGTFTEPGPPYYGIKPPPAMTNSLVDLLAWKADLEDIDPWDSSYADSLFSGRPNLMGHRDAHGTTTCPGEQAHDMLPEIRQRVAERLDFVPDRIYIDELSSGFRRSDANWYTGPKSCGFNGNAWYTFSTTDSSIAVNNGTWTFQVPADGWYVVDAMIPFCNTGRPETDGATYTVSHAHGPTNVLINQDDHMGLWAKLGSYEFKAGQNYTVFLTDLAVDNDKGLWFDAIRLTPAAGDDLPTPKFTPISPKDGEWTNQQTIRFEWTFDDFYGPQQWALRLSTTEDMKNVVADVTVAQGVTNTTATLDQVYPELYWQIQVLGLTPPEPDPENIWRVGIDVEPPSTDIVSVLKKSNGSYQLLLTGNDNASGVVSYTVEYRRIEEGRAAWTVLTSELPGNSVQFVPGDDGMYEFRVYGVDGAGNQEAPEDTPNGSTEDATVLTPAVFLPVISKP